MAPQGAPKVQERPEGVRELAEQVRLLEADLEAGLGRGDAGKARAVGVKHHQVLPRDQLGHIRQVVDRVESQAKSLQVQQIPQSCPTGRY